MPVQIQIRNGTAAQWTSANPVLAAGEVGIENDTRKQKFGDGTTAWNSLAYAGGGTVTGVTAASPVLSSGGVIPSISLASGYGDTLNPYASKTANQVLAAPNGTSGVPSFRALVSADIPTLNQNTTGTAAGLSSTLAIASGGTGATTAISAFNALAPSQSGNSGKYLTTDGTNSSWGTVSGGGSPGGSNTQVQFNSSGSFGGSANLTFNGTTLTATGLAGPHDGTVGATTPATGSFTTLAASSTVSGTGFSTYLASPPAIGGTAAAAGTFTQGSFSSTVHRGATSGTVTMTAPAVAGTQGYTLPTALPAANGYVLSSTTGGVMSWVAASAPATAPSSVDFLVIAGGGGSGLGASNLAGAGGGAGGYRTSVGTSGGGGAAESQFPVTAGTTYTVTIGPGGAGSTSALATGTNGTASAFSTITTVGGGGGGSSNASIALSGGSGGGGGPLGSPYNGAGTANQGYAGGVGASSVPYSGGGGGGAGSVGGDGTNTNGGNGGSGVSSTISGSAVTRAGGGGGQGVTTGGSATGGGGNGANGANVGANGTDNFGAGGGGGSTTAGNGGSGVVIIRYPDTNTAAASTTGSPSINVSGGYRIYTFTGSGSITW